MFLDDLKVIEPRDDRWLVRVIENAFVWLAKEQEYAQIEWRWQRPDVLREIGRVGLCRFRREGDEWYEAGQQTWWMYADGTGFDRQPLLLPIAGHCPPPRTSAADYIGGTAQAVSNQAFWDSFMQPLVIPYRLLYPESDEPVPAPIQEPGRPVHKRN